GGGAGELTGQVTRLSGSTYRYFLSQPLQAGDVVVTFIAGSWSFVDGGTGDLVVTLGEVGPDAPFIVHEGAVAIDVPFPVAPGHHVDVTTLGEFDEFTLGGAGLGSVALDRAVAPQVLGDGTTVRYRIAGTFATSGVVTATFHRGTWSVLDPAGAVSTVNLGTHLADTNDRTYLDVQ